VSNKKEALFLGLNTKFSPNVGVKDLLSRKGLNNGGDMVQGKSSKCIKMKHVDRSNILEDLLKN